MNSDEIEIKKRKERDEKLSKYLSIKNVYEMADYLKENEKNDIEYYSRVIGNKKYFRENVDDIIEKAIEKYMFIKDNDKLWYKDSEMYLAKKNYEFLFDIKVPIKLLLGWRKDGENFPILEKIRDDTYNILRLKVGIEKMERLKK